MNTLEVAAHFAAFTCYLNSDPSKPHSPDEAGRLARKNWKSFLPYVGEDLGKFLTAPAPKARSKTATSVAPKRMGAIGASRNARPIRTTVASR